MITTITIAGIESESISAIVAIMDNHQRSQKVNGNHQCSDSSDRNGRDVPAIIWKPKHIGRNDRDDHSNRMCPAIRTIPVTIRKSNFSNCDDRSDLMFLAIATIVTIVNDHMETRLYKSIIKPPTNSIKKAILNI